MSGTTPNRGSDPGPERDPFTQPVGRPSEQPRWRESSSLSWEDATAGGQPTPPSEPPRPILTAAKLMYIGAVVSALFILLELMSRGGRRELYIEQNPDATASEIDSAVSTVTTYSVILWGAATVLWVWMAWANKKGFSWARVVSTVLGALNLMFFSFGALLAGGFGVGTLISLISPALAAVVLYLLYRPEAGEFYRQTTRRVF